MRMPDEILDCTCFLGVYSTTARGKEFRLTGTAFCLTYRSSGGHAPVVLITAALNEAVAAAVEACGAVGHIRKPFSIEHVLEMVERYVTRPLGRTA